MGDVEKKYSIKEFEKLIQKFQSKGYWGNVELQVSMVNGSISNIKVSSNITYKKLALSDK